MISPLAFTKCSILISLREPEPSKVGVVIVTLQLQLTLILLALVLLPAADIAFSSKALAFFCMEDAAPNIVEPCDDAN